MKLVHEIVVPYCLYLQITITSSCNSSNIFLARAYSYNIHISSLARMEQAEGQLAPAAVFTHGAALFASLPALTTVVQASAGFRPPEISTGDQV